MGAQPSSQTNVNNPDSVVFKNKHQTIPSFINIGMDFNSDGSGFTWYSILLIVLGTLIGKSNF